jgi:hypothetical protein
MKCNNCNKLILLSILNLGKQPLANRYIIEENKIDYEEKYALKIYFCKKCGLIQTNKNINPKEIFEEDYAYLSSTSEYWLGHAQEYVKNINKDLKIESHDYILEVASNDGYLLQFFNEKNIKTLGVEPTKIAHELAVAKGINSINEFFDIDLAQKILTKYGSPKLIVANNVIAHVPNRIEFLKAIKILCNEETLITLEFHDAKNLIRKRQFDTIYHEHYSYFTLESIDWLLNDTGFYIEKHEELSTHGGSLRIYARIKKSATKNDRLYIYSSPKSEILTKKELKKFRKYVRQIRNKSKKFIRLSIKEGKTFSGFGAAAKGNTFLNYLNIKYPEIKFVVDNSNSKKGKLLPGSHIPIVSLDSLKNNPTDYLIILPWNIYDEIKSECINNGIHIKLVKFIPGLSIEQI